MLRRLQRHRVLRRWRVGVATLPPRAWLTLRHLGPRELLRRLVGFPRRLLRARSMAKTPGFPEHLAPVIDGWYRWKARPVAIVIPTYGDPSLVRDAVRSIRSTVPRRDLVRIIVADDGSAAAHVRRLRRIRGIELVEGAEQRGFAANCNRGIERLRPEEDLVLLNSDVIAHERWLEGLQYTAYNKRDAGIVGPKLLYADGTIQSAGSVRNAGAPEWFDHRYRFKPAHHPPASHLVECIAVTGAAMYVRRECLAAIGGRFDEAYGMAFEDTDWCLRAWDAGFRVYYTPYSTLTHLESKTRGLDVQGERELASQALFWERWRAWLDDRPVQHPDGGLHIVYVTEGTGVGGGHRVVFQHLLALREAGHHVELWSLQGRPDWFALGDIPVRSFTTYDALEAALEPLEAIKVATWWRTSEAVWLASLRHGLPAYFVQDIESSYYESHDPETAARALDSYRQELHTLTTSTWNRDRLRELHIDPVVVPPGLDERFGVLGGVERREDMVLALGRSDPLKNFALTRAAWERLDPRPQLWLFGIEPQLADAEGIRYVQRPSDAEVNRLLNEATVFVQTSRHEGFCLPILEAMAAGVPVVCTDADGNRDFCHNGVNCLMPAAEPGAVAAAIRRLLDDHALRERLARAGLETAAEHRWARHAPALVRFYESLAGVGAQA